MRSPQANNWCIHNTKHNSMILTTKNKELAIFGQTLNDVKKKLIDFNDIWMQGGRFGSSKQQFIPEEKIIKELSLDEAVQQLKSLNQFVVSGKMTYEQYFNTIGKGNTVLKTYVTTTDQQSQSVQGLIKASQDARAAQIAHNEQIKNLTFSAKAGKVALQALTTVGNMFAMWIIGKVIDAATTAFDNWTHSMDNAKEELEEANSKLEEVNSELAATVSRIDELHAKENLSLVEAEELEKLKTTNTELERELRIREELAKVNGTKANKEALLYFNSTSGSFWESFFADFKDIITNFDFFGGNNLSFDVSPVFTDKVFEAEYYIEQAEKLKQKLTKIADKDSKDYKSISAEIKEIEENLSKTIVDFMEKDDLLIEGEDHGLLERLAALYEKYDVYTNGNAYVVENKLSSILAKVDFADNAKELEELGKSGELSLDNIASKFPNLIAYLDRAGISAQELYQYIMALANPDAINYSNVKKQLLYSIGGRQDEAQESLREILSLDKEEFVLEAYLKVRAQYGDHPEGWTAKDWIYNIQQELNNNPVEFKTSISSFEDAWSDLLASEEESTKKLGETLFDLAEKGRLTTEVFNEADSMGYFKNLGISADEAAYKINQLADITSQLSSMSSQISKISEALETKRDNDFVSADTLSGFDAEIRGLDSWDHFQEVLGNVNSFYDDCRKAANALASEWLNSNDFLAQLTEQNKEYYATQLKAMGVENYEELLTYAQELDTAKKALSLASFDLAAATYDEVQALINDGTYSDLAQQQIWNLVLAKQVSEGLTLSTAADCENLAALAQNAGVTGNAITLLTRLMNLYNNMTNGIYGNNQHAIENAKKEAASLKNQIDSVLSKNVKEAPVIKPRLILTPSVKSISDDAKNAADDTEKAAEEAARAAEEALDRFLSAQEAALHAGKLSFQEYCHTVSSYLQTALASGTIGPEKYWSAWQSFLNVQKNSHDAAISAVTRRIDREINALRDNQDSMTAAYQSQIDSLEKQKELLQGANEERKRQLDLQKALYEQERAYHQRTILRYSEDQGLHYVQDSQALRDAKTQVEDTRLQIRIAEIDKSVAGLEEMRDSQKAAIDSMISDLENYKEQWNHISTAYEEAQDSRLAAMILGQNWEADILCMRTDVLTAFTDNYIRLQQQIADAAWESANAQIEAQKEAAKGAEGTTRPAQSPGISEPPSAPEPAVPKKKTIISGGGGNAQKLAFVRADSTLLRFHTGLKQGPVDSHSFDDDFRLVQRAGLKSNEVPAILKEGEAVATQEQIRNLAGSLRLTGNSQNNFVLLNGTKLSPLQPGDEMYDLVRKFNTYLENIDGRLEKMLPSAVYEQNRQMANAANPSVNSSVVNNKNVQPVSVGDIHITCPGITSQEVARQVGDQLNHMFSGLHLDAMQRSTMR